MSVTQKILKCATKKSLTVATAESCTGGLIAAALTDLPGSSAIFEFGFVTYSNIAKVEMLGVKPETLATFGAVSEPVAAEMAAGARQRSHSDIALSVTGIAGPGGSEFKPEGRVCFGLVTQDQSLTQTVEFGALGRDIVRQRSRDHALAWILDTLHGG